jgi:hypothetical protein
VSRPDYLPECPASIHGLCLAATYGRDHCDTGAGECAEAAEALPPEAQPGVRLAVVAALDEPAAAATEATGHVYLSTGCFHGDHDYCKSMTGLNGAKRPGSCKHCGTKCQCPCHSIEEAGP